MTLLRDRVLMLRALGVALLTGLAGVAARQYRESLVAHGTYLRDDYDAATTLTLTCWSVAVLAAVFVGLHLLVTPRTPAAPRGGEGGAG